MSLFQARELCQRLAEDTLERIRADRQRASVPVAALLKGIEERLLDPDLQVSSLRPGGKHDKRLLTRFGTEIGLTPWAYVIQCRMEIAGRMLATAGDRTVWMVAASVGYLSAKSFSRAFKSWSQLSPREFRRQALADTERVPPSPPRALLTADEIQRALDGHLPASEAATLVGRLQSLQTQIRTNYQLASPPIPRAESIEPTMARNVWRWIKDEPNAVQQAAVTSQSAAFRTPALFHLLCAESIEAGFDDVDRGLEIASLANICVPTLARNLEKDQALTLAARGHAVAGLAFQRSGLLDDAREAYDFAQQMLAEAGAGAHPVVVVELCLYYAVYELECDNFEVGIQLARQGIELMRTLIEKIKESARLSSDE